MVKVPKAPNADVMKQGTTVYYRDGSRMVQIGSSRIIEPIDKISPNMQWAAIAIEDHNFYNESAISPKGIARAVYNNVSGGSTEGGSTITQQYVKNAYLTQQRTFSRKFKEIFIAIKVGKQEDKKTILQHYLNTIYFGYGANGVEAAAQTYFGPKVHASDLTVPQAAVLAANIKQPQYYDPRSKGQQHTDAVNRYNLVLDAMRRMGKLSDADYAKFKDKPPLTVKQKDSELYRGQRGYMIQRVKNALHGMNFTDEQINNGGLKVYTTWDKNLQTQAQKTVEADLRAHRMPSDTNVGLVTVNPINGEILAAYGGRDYLKRAVDDVFYSTAQVGSSIKPFVLAAAEKEGIGLKSTMDATAPAYINTDGDRVSPSDPSGHPFTNDEGNPRQPVVNMITSLAQSYNTIFVPLGYKAGTPNVVQLEKDAGLPEEALKRGNPGEGGFFLGQSDMRPLDLITGFATIANDGEYVTPHSIRKVIDKDNKVHKPSNVTTRRAFNAQIAHDVQYAMQQVVKTGTGTRAQLLNHEVAGKTGTTSANKAVWFSGFTPKVSGANDLQYVTTVGMWRFHAAKKHQKAEYLPLQNIGDYSHINGGDLPAQMWHDFMTKALEGKSTEQFPPPAYYAPAKAYATASPSTTPTPTMTPTCQPGQNPVTDDCKPRKTPNPTSTDQCTQFPQLPQCRHHSQSPDPTSTCKPWDMNCTSPSTNPSGPGKHGNTAQDVQGQAARPLKD
ncbi:transglycosylase domain-containing protein [Actinoallomurus sp. NPDC052308]|uniref:transglycosylase domain-containing protein n=1 Tax=Actinoallomurus sp. NPDC052308 TaxID=3155530 RepID=UPI003434B605